MIRLDKDSIKRKVIVIIILSLITIYLFVSSLIFLREYNNGFFQWEDVRTPYYASLVLGVICSLFLVYTFSSFFFRDGIKYSGHVNMASAILFFMLVLTCTGITIYNATVFYKDYSVPYVRDVLIYSVFMILVQIMFLFYFTFSIARKSNFKKIGGIGKDEIDSEDLSDSSSVYIEKPKGLMRRNMLGRAKLITDDD